MTEPLTPYFFVIDTDHYSGNFERQMCAYITGRVGECEVGHDEAEVFQKECKISFDNVTDQGDEHGCRRPCTIYTTPGWFNDGMGNEYEEGTDPKEVARKYKQACQKAYGQSKKWSGQKWPSYQSVAILFDSEPDKKQIDVMQKRAEKFGKNQNIKILGFRLFKVEIQTIPIPLS